MIECQLGGNRCAAGVACNAWQEGPYEAAAALDKALGSCRSDVGNKLANEVLEASDQRAAIAN